MVSCEQKGKRKELTYYVYLRSFFLLPTLLPQVETKQIWHAYWNRSGAPAGVQTAMLLLLAGLHIPAQYDADVIFQHRRSAQVPAGSNPSSAYIAAVRHRNGDLLYISCHTSPCPWCHISAAHRAHLFPTIKLDYISFCYTFSYTERYMFHSCFSDALCPTLIESVISKCHAQSSSFSSNMWNKTLVTLRDILFTIVEFHIYLLLH